MRLDEITGPPEGDSGQSSPEEQERERQRAVWAPLIASSRAEREKLSPREQLLWILSDWDGLPAYGPAAIHDGRKAALEDALLALETQMRPYRDVNTTLYRGIVLTPEQCDDLIDTGSCTVPQSRIGSWTKSYDVAKDFAAEMPGRGIVIGAEADRLDVLVDFEAVARSRKRSEKGRFDIEMAVREEEVLVRNSDPQLVVSRGMVVWKNFR